MTDSPSTETASTDARRALLLHCLDEAIAAAHPARCLVPHLPAPGQGRLIILGAGKAGGSMAAVASATPRKASAEKDSRASPVRSARSVTVTVLFTRPPRNDPSRMPRAPYSLSRM